MAVAAFLPGYRDRNGVLCCIVPPSRLRAAQALRTNVQRLPGWPPAVIIIDCPSGGTVAPVRLVKAGMRHLRIQCVLALSVSLLALVLGAEALASDGLSLRREGRLLRVESEFLSLLISPENGGRVVSLLFDGTEMTALDSSGHGGLIEEVHTADFPFSVTEQRWSDGRLRLTMEATAADLRVVKEYVFRADRPSFQVRLTFENHSAYALSGAGAPALRGLALPAGTLAADRQVYCLNRGRGAEMLSRGPFLHRLNADPGGRGLRWVAVGDPVTRRVLGFALHEGAGRCLRPLRSSGGAAVVGWSYPALPPRSAFTVTVTVAALQGFSTLSELNPRFAADSVTRWRADRLHVHLRMRPLGESLPEVSVITRTYDESGVELEPCDPVLFESLEPLNTNVGDTRSAASTEPPAWLLHEVYSRGQLVSRFAVPAAATVSSGPPQRGSVEPPATVSLAGGARTEEGAMPLTEQQRERGFVAWHFDGGGPRAEPGVAEVVLAAGEQRTLFFGVRALRDVEHLRFNLAGDASEGDGPASVPAAAVDLWTVEQPPGEPARLVPRTALALGQGETAWVALTADGSGLRPGIYAGDLMFSGPGVLRVPFKLVVREHAAPGPRSFALWYEGPWDEGDPPGPVLAKLRGYGVDALTLPARSPDALRREARRSAFSFLAFQAGGGTLPPPGPGSRTALPYPHPVWVVRTDAAGPTVAAAARENGWTPALLGASLPPSQFLSRLGGPVFVAVRQGCGGDDVRELVESGGLSGEEPVWIHLDLREADWRRAALEVRSAFWAAAWQGLAGATVTCDPPQPAVDRQLAIWHVLRDARQEVALWREARREAGLRLSEGEPSRPQLLLREKLTSVVGPAEHCTLCVRPERRPFRSVYRVCPAAGDDDPLLERFTTARRTVLDVLKELSGYPRREEAANLYWQGIPLLRDGRPQWMLVALEGETAWKAARRLRQQIEERTGLALEAQRSLPAEPGDGAARLVIVSAPPGPSPLPEPFPPGSVHGADRPPVVMQQPGGTVLVAFRGEGQLHMIVRGLCSRSSLYATAREMR